MRTCPEGDEGGPGEEEVDVGVDAAEAEGRREEGERQKPEGEAPGEDPRRPRRRLPGDGPG
jgi:hypothetical protein